MKKATTKRDRKYGKKNDEGIKVTNGDTKVKVMVDYYHIIKFNNKTEAEIYINKKHKEEEERGQVPTSFIYL